MFKESQGEDTARKVPGVHGDIMPGTYVETHGAQLTFEEITEMIGQIIVKDCSTESREVFMAVKVANIIPYGLSARLPDERMLKCEYPSDDGRCTIFELCTETQFHTCKFYRMAGDGNMKIKGFDKDLKCRGYQFEIGKIYDTGAKDDEIKLCTDKVFHYCDSLRDVHAHYPCDSDNRYCEIEVLGAEVTDGEKRGSNRIRIVREITGAELDALMGKSNGNTGCFNTGDCNTGDCNTGDWNIGTCNTGDFNTSDWNTGNWNTGNCNTGLFNTGDRNTGDRNTGNFNTGGANTGWFNTGDWNTGDGNTGDRNAGNWNTGAFNTCSHSTGFFCTVEENIRLFNRPSGMTRSEFTHSGYYRALLSAPFRLTEWIGYSESEMDTPEKRAMGGYLKKYTYKEACGKWWDAMTEENRSIIRSMPNFNAEIFREITGVNVDETNRD